MTYPATPTYWLEPTEQVAVGLRRYSTAADHSDPDDAPRCPLGGGYHHALVFTGANPAWFEERANGQPLLRSHNPRTPHDDPRWPTRCRCGYEFLDEDEWQDWEELIYRRSDTGAEVVLRSRDPDEGDTGPAVAPPGACWDAWWMPPSWRGADNIALMVRCPSGRDWHVDGKASNCTRPDEPHKCWVRHGDPRECDVTVDKDGDTCSAGAGSIVAGDYHGFLILGLLTAG